jgi:adenosylhomocysteine nucleosidase
VVASHFIQHDMDASPLFERFEVPLYGQSCFAADVALAHQLVQASNLAVQALGLAATVHRGLLASGDQFVGSAQASGAVCRALAAAGHQPLAVEMEGAAVAQACHDYGVPFAAVRTISDRADNSAHIDFALFSRDVASCYAEAIVRELVKLL